MIDSSSFEKERTKKIEELIDKFATLSKDSNIPEIGNLLSDELKQGSLPFEPFGQTIGLNYNVEEYFVDLPDGKVLNYDIGGKASIYIEKVRLMTREEADQRKEIINLTERASKIASHAVNDGGPEDRKIALADITNLVGQILLLHDRLQIEVHKDKLNEISRNESLT